MADAVSDYDEENTASVTDDGGSNPTISDKAHPIIISEGSGTGTGDCQFSTSTWNNIDGVEDIGVFDQNDNLLDFEIEKLDTTNNTAVVWVYVGSLNRDNTDQVKVAAGSGSTDDQSVSGTWDNANQNAHMVQHMEESSGTLFDETSNNIDSTSETITSYGVDGQFGDAIDLDGTDDQVDLTASSEFSALTVVAWPNLDTVNDGDDDWVLGLRNNQKWQMYENGGSWTVHSNDSGANGSTLTATAGTSVTQLAWTWDGTNQELYVDGTQQDSSSDLSSLTANGSGGASDSIGYYSGGPGRYFDGTIDEVRVYTESKSADWVQADWDASPAGGQDLFSWNGAQATAQTISATTTSVTTSTPNPSVTPGTATVAADETVIATSNPAPAVNPGTVTVSASETVVATSTPNPGVTEAFIINAPETTVTSSTPSPSVTPGATTIAADETVVTVSTPNPDLDWDLTIEAPATAVATSTPSPSVTPGAVTVSADTTSVTLNVVSPEVVKEFISINPTKVINTTPNKWVSMSGDSHTFKEGDTADNFEATLKDDNGATDLSVSSVNHVKFYMRNRETGNLKIDGRQINITDAANGKVEVDWQSGDLDTPGVYDCEFVVDTTTGDDSFPNSGYHVIEVDEDA